MKTKVLTAAAALMLSGCIYNSSGSSVVSYSMLHRLLPGSGSATQPAEETTSKADPSLNHLIVRTSSEEIRTKRQATALIRASLINAKHTTDRALCADSRPIRAKVVDEVGPERKGSGEWVFRLSWKAVDGPVCGSVSAESYYRAFSANLPKGTVIYQAGVGADSPPALYRNGEQIHDPLELIDIS